MSQSNSTIYNNYSKGNQTNFIVIGKLKTSKIELLFQIIITCPSAWQAKQPI